MMLNNSKHLPHYISLVAILISGVLGFYLFSYDKYFQIAISVALSASYVSWGIIHHAVHKDICWTILFEYLVVAILGLIMILSLIFRT